MFENLSARLEKVLKYLRGEVTLSEENMLRALREIRLSLLEADVNYKVVKTFVEGIREKAVGAKVHDSLNPSQQVIKIVQESLQEILGREARPLSEVPLKPTVLMLTGLQGSGKTTTAGKLGLFLKERGKSALLASLDRKRPAAREQLETIARDIGLACHAGEGDYRRLVPALLQQARDYGYDYVIADTAGRLHVDEELMAELRSVKELLRPHEVIFVADSLTGQDAVQSAQEFATAIGIHSIILTKLDADSRGGAALSIVSVTGRPIAFIGVGEKYADFQVFHPDRLAAKILGMGDVLTLIEKTQQQFDEKQAEALGRKLREEEFSLDDFAQQLLQVQKLGSLQEIMGMLPAGKNLNVDEDKVRHTVAIIRSMTRRERENPKIIDGRRRQRIARGSGRPVAEVNQLLKGYFEMKKYMKKPLFKRLLKKIDISGKIM